MIRNPSTSSDIFNLVTAPIKLAWELFPCFENEFGEKTVTGAPRVIARVLAQENIANAQLSIPNLPPPPAHRTPPSPPPATPPRSFVRPVIERRGL